MAPRCQAGAKQRLTFTQKLSKDSKLTTAELIKRLTALHKELGKLDQENTDTESLASVRKELISPSLLVHKDRGVKAFVACCFADILRLYAPDAPYTGPELRDIFQFFFRQLKNLANTKDTTGQAEYIYLVESLANVQSIVLVCDIPACDEVMSEVFRLCFDVVSSDMAKNIPLTFADLLSQIIGQASSIPSTVLEMLLAQFESSQVKKNPAAYRLASDVATACADRLQRDVCRYFSDIILSTSSIFHSQPDEDASDNDHQDLDQVTKAHTLIANLHRAAPGLLLNVIPQLEEELKMETLELRLLATRTLARILSMAPQSSATSKASSSTLAWDLAHRYPTAWRGWLGRAKDKTPAVRISVVEAIPKILLVHPELGPDLSTVILGRLQDPDDKVRLAAVSTVGSLEYEVALHHVDVSVLKAVGERCTDKKGSIQEESLKVLGKFYQTSFSDIADDDEAAIAHFGWIPGQVLRSAAIGNPRLSNLAEKCLLDCILPLPRSAGEESVWADRLVAVIRTISPDERIIFKRLTRLSDTRPNMFDKYLEACEANNGGIIEENEDEVRTTLDLAIQRLSAAFPDATHAQEDLKKFAGMNDNRLYKLLKTLGDVQNDFVTLVKTYYETQRRVEQASSALVGTFDIFARRMGYLFLNGCTIPTLLKSLRSTEDHESSSDAARWAMDLIALGKPTMTKPFVGDLVRCLATQNSPVAVDSALLALSELAKVEPDSIPSDARVLERSLHFATTGTLHQAKLAATLLAHGGGRKNTCRDAYNEIVGDLKDVEGDRLIAHLGALSRIVKHAPDVFNDHSSTVTTFLLKNILMEPSEGNDDEEEWVEDDDVDNMTHARVLALKVLINRCVAYGNSDSAGDVAKPVLKVLWQLLETRDQIGTAKHSPSVASRLRLQAAKGCVRLASLKSTVSLVEEKFDLLALTAQDSCFQVREKFIGKLVKYLHFRRIANPKFNLILYMVAHDPEQDIIDQARNSIISRMKVTPEKFRVHTFEATLVRLLHLLAHHPDFSVDVEDIRIFTRYIEFFLTCVGSATNLSLLYHLAAKLKTIRDTESQAHSESLYTLSELAQLIIRLRAQSHGWALSTYPGSIKLPSDIFSPLPNPQVASQIFKKTYLPIEIAEDMTLKSSKSSNHQEKKSSRATNNNNTATNSTGATTSSSRRKRKSVTKDESTVAKTSPSKSKSKAKKKRVKKDWEGESEDQVGGTSSDESHLTDEASRLKIKEPTTATGTRSRPQAKVAKQASKTKKSTAGTRKKQNPLASDDNSSLSDISTPHDDMDVDS